MFLLVETCTHRLSSLHPLPVGHLHWSAGLFCFSKLFLVALTADRPEQNCQHHDKSKARNDHRCPPECLCQHGPNRFHYHPSIRMLAIAKVRTDIVTTRIDATMQKQQNSTGYNSAHALIISASNIGLLSLLRSFFLVLLLHLQVIMDRANHNSSSVRSSPETTIPNHGVNRASAYA